MPDQKLYTFEDPAGTVWKEDGLELGVSVDDGVEMTDAILRDITLIKERTRKKADMIDATGTKFAVTELNDKTLNRLADLLSALTGLPFVRKEMQKAAADTNA